MMTIEEVKELVLTLGKKIGIKEDYKLYPMFAKFSNVFSEGSSVYVDESAYHFVAMERGKVVEQYESEDVNDILYQVFAEITSFMASNYEVKHRKEDEDPRRGCWKEELRLLKMINPMFVEMRLEEINMILKNYPFKDGKGKDLL